MQRYENIYEKREIDDGFRFGKPHDTWVITDCVKFARKQGVEIINLHEGTKHRSPMKRTVLGEYFMHSKGKSKHVDGVS